MNKVVICGTVPEDGKRMFREQLSARTELVFVSTPDEAAQVEDAKYIVVRGGKFTTEVIKKLPASVKLIHRWGVGYDSVDIDQAAAQGIHVAICTGGNAEPVAELAILLILACLRKLPALIDRAKSGSGDKNDIIKTTYIVQDKTVGLIGFGNIGSRVAKAVQAMGAKVVYYDAFRMSPEREAQLNVEYVDLDTLLASSDIVSVHVPLMESTQHMINAETIAKMKDNALLVNTARGPIVNLEDVLAAIDSGKLLGAGFDTVEGEPLPADHPIFSNPKVILTPHAGGNTCDNTANMVNIIVDNILCMEDGNLPAKKFIVNQVK